MRVPLEKEVPVTPVVEEPELEAEEQEFPELTEVKTNRLCTSKPLQFQGSPWVLKNVLDSKNSQ